MTSESHPSPGEPLLIDAGGGAAEVIGDEPTFGWPERLALAYRATWPGRHPRAVTAATSAVALGIAVMSFALAQRPASTLPLPATPVEGISLRVLPGLGVRDAVPELVAAFRVMSPLANSRYSITALSGPFLRASFARPTQLDGSVGAVVSVGVVPDCTDRASLGSLGASYSATLVRTDSAGREASGVVDLSTTGLDVASAVRRYCWQVAASQGLVLYRLEARPDHHAQQVVVNASLRNDVGLALQLRVVDIADVDTIAAADAGVMAPDATRTFRIRLPVHDCSSPVLPLGTSGNDAGTGPGPVLGLTWSVGPVGADPAALAATSLSPQQLVDIRRAVAALCAPPDTSVRVVSARVMPSSPAVIDHTGVSIDVRLSLVSAAERLIAGDNETGLTPDARVAITSVDVTPQDGRALGQVVWHARCDAAGTWPPTLTLRLLVDGRWNGYSIQLGEALLARTYAAACHLSDPSALRETGWDLAVS